RSPTGCTGSPYVVGPSAASRCLLVVQQLVLKGLPRRQASARCSARRRRPCPRPTFCLRGERCRRRPPPGGPRRWNWTPSASDPPAPTDVGHWVGLLRWGRV